MVKKILFFSFLIIVVVAAAWGYRMYQKTKPVSYQFAGQVKSFSNNELAIEGAYIFEQGPQGDLSKRTVIAKLDSDTKIVKVSIFLPTIAEVRANGGSYNADSLRHETATGTTSDLAPDTAVIVRATGNINNKLEFKVSEVKYTIPVFPD